MRSRLLGLVIPALAILPLGSACSSSARSPFANKPAPDASTEPAPEAPAFEAVERPDASDDDDTEQGCNPSASRFDFPDNDCDDDGDGEVDNTPAGCDEGLPITGNAEQFAAALGLCQKADDAEGRWGIVSAKYTKGYKQSAGPADGQHGILPGFGPLLKTREGEALGVLSTGWARVFDGADGKTGAFKDGGSMQSGLSGALPPGFPKASTGCPSIGTPNDVAVLKLEIKTPKNAKGFQFDFDFYSGEWPEWVCSTFNDGFIAYLKSSAFNNGAGDNVSFDSTGAPVSVNNAFFDRCTPNTEVGCSGSVNVNGPQIAACPGGSDEIAGTGFAKLGSYCGSKQSTGGGATGWLTSQAPIKGGETITLEFYIWDSGDSSYNSSVLLDNFKWIPKPVEAATGRPK